MYDTIKLVSPDITSELATKLIGKCYTHQNVNMETGEMSTRGKPATIYGEFNNAISIAIRYDRWTKGSDTPPSKVPCSPRIILEASIHKALVGHNIYGGPKSILASIAYLIGTVEKRMDVSLPPAMDWEVERVDVAEVFLMDNEEQITTWFRGLLYGSYPRRENKITRYGWGGLYIQGGTTNINIYHKGPEIKHKDRDYKRLKRIPVLINQVDPIKLADNIFKAEVQIHKRKLKSDYGRIPLVKDLNDSYFERLWAREMYKLFKESGKDMRFVRNHESVRVKLQNLFTLDKANRLEAFWLKLASQGEATVKRSMSGKLSTFNKYRKELIDNDISWIGNDLIFPDCSIIPEDFAVVRDNKYHYDVDLSEVEEKLKSYLPEV